MPTTSLTNTEQKVLDFMVENDESDEDNDLSTISEGTLLPPKEVRAALLSLEKKGLIVKTENYTPTEKGMKKLFED
jgi:DNA-binding MarR family transcriptional regulator